MVSIKPTSLVCLLTFIYSVIAGGIPNIPQCSSCFNSLPKGCMEKITTSVSNPVAAQSAYQDCLCTKQYINNFMNCATCSAKSMNSNQLPTEKDRNEAIVSCSSHGFPIPDSVTSPTQSGNHSEIAGSNKSGTISGPLSNQTSTASGENLVCITMVSGITFMGLKLVN
ncbi:hypothetical protein K7432_008469 [Basidiobolus ranarum]|uniref:Uncharacterized protein n=1 Tax=Basidiobolus ranarum TaxID=34480 RepID=A0ABR2VYI1_9FUNG